MNIRIEIDGKPALSGKTALVSGGNGGIGLSVCRGFAENGANCVVADLPQSPSEELGALMAEYPGAVRYVPTNICDGAARKILVESCTESFGSIDILFNNAAVFDMGPLLESDEAQYERLFRVNVNGMFFLMQAVADEMVNAGNGGKIINMASQAGRRGEALVSHYCASKAAVISYTQSAALALAPHGINVNAISPGVVDTPMWDHVDSLFARYEHRQPGEKKRLVGEDVPLGRMGVPEDICGAALFLASGMSDYVTAQTYNVDGGNVMS
ncbi:L-iditol 2-dehydrogenase [Parasalinivibrio latis]|uniref:L-iditol 2-dehydrogenase n=1 Tax=Parasalinivibrio latis TaxID=2952610 RepID=UPI0030DF6968